MNDKDRSDKYMEIAVLLTEAADAGRPLEWRGPYGDDSLEGGKWQKTERFTPRVDQPMACWRVAPPPAKKVIDLSVLVGSGVDCEFWDEEGEVLIGALTHSFDGSGPYQCDKRLWFPHCQPRMNHWHSWQGGECPLPEGFVVEAYTRTGRLLPEAEATTLRWRWRYSYPHNDPDIITFRVLRKADDYCMPWEVNHE